MTSSTQVRKEERTTERKFSGERREPSTTQRTVASIIATTQFKPRNIRRGPWSRQTGRGQLQKHCASSLAPVPKQRRWLRIALPVQCGKLLSHCVTRGMDQPKLKSLGSRTARLKLCASHQNLRKEHRAKVSREERILLKTL